MLVVAGVTGNTGKVVAETLLAHGKPVRVIVRDEEKAAPWRARGAETAITSMDDTGGVARAFSGADGAYVLIPPQYAAPDLLAAQKKITDALAEAASASRIPHLVLLSSVGAQHPSGTGPIRALHHAEKTLGKAAGNFTRLRAGYFLENWAPVLPEARSKGVLPTFLRPGRPVPMIATRDIGRTAAEALLDPPRGNRTIELAGLADWTPEDVARSVSELLGRDVRLQASPLDAVVPAFMAMGLSEATSLLMREMYEGVNSGLVSFEGGDAIMRFGTLGPADVFRTPLAVG